MAGRRRTLGGMLSTSQRTQSWSQQVFGAVRVVPRPVVVAGVGATAAARKPRCCCVWRPHHGPSPIAGLGFVPQYHRESNAWYQWVASTGMIVTHPHDSARATTGDGAEEQDVGHAHVPARHTRDAEQYIRPRRRTRRP
jgi:hypothetical protein